jgi:C-terminal processing protease CtpA/Prc
MDRLPLRNCHFFGRSLQKEELASKSKKIRPGDILVAVNGIDVEGKTLFEVNQLIEVAIYHDAMQSI